MVRACCVPQCKSGKKVPSHKFPKDPIRCQKWVKSLNLHHLENLCANELQKYQICHKHFREEDYSCSSLRNRFLTNTAIPLLYINNDDASADVVDIAGTVSNVQQPLQLLLKENESEQQNKVSQSMPIDVSDVQKQIQQHSEQLSKQHHLLETFNVQHIKLQKEVFEMQQKMYEKDIEEKNKLQQSHCQEKESVIQDCANRLTRLEEQMRIITTPKRRKVFQMRPILRNVTRTANLTPTARMLYNTSVRLKRTNTRLKRLIQQRKKSKEKETLSKHNKVNSIGAVQQQFIDMLQRNSTVRPQVYNMKI